MTKTKAIVVFYTWMVEHFYFGLKKSKKQNYIYKTKKYIYIKQNYIYIIYIIYIYNIYI